MLTASWMTFFSEQVFVPCLFDNSKTIKSSLLATIHLIIFHLNLSTIYLAGRDHILGGSVQYTACCWMLNLLCLLAIFFLKKQVLNFISMMSPGRECSFLIVTGLNIEIGPIQKEISMTWQLFCQNDCPMEESFWQKDSLISHILF